MRRALVAAGLVLAVAACSHRPTRPPRTAPPARPEAREPPARAPEAPEAPAAPPRADEPGPAEAPPAEASPAPRTQLGLASFYHRKLQGRRTANGERYDGRALTAAHRTARFGTRLRVTELAGGKSVVVRVNDRGPFVRGRVVDLSLAAARALGIVHRGLAQVRVEFLE